MRFKSYLKSIFIVIAVLLLFSVPAFSQDGVSTSPADFLNIDIGAKSIGMGGAYSSVADTAETIFLNPAGIINMNMPFLSTHAGIQFDGTYSAALAFAMPPKEGSKFGFGIGIMGFAGITDINGYDATGNPTGNNISNYFFAPYVTFAFKQSLIGSGDGIGFSIKALISNTGSINGFGGGLDVGFLTKIAVINLGLTIKDLFTIIKFPNRDYIEFVSPRIILGASFETTNQEDKLDDFVISIEMDKALLNPEFSFSIGTLFRIWKYKKPIENNEEIDDIDDLIGDVDEEEASNMFGTNLYILAGYDFKTLSFGLSFTLAPINMKLDIATQFPTKQGEYFTLYTNLEFHF